MKQKFSSVYKELPDGLNMFIKYWPHAREQLKGTLLIVHGLGETADYYDEVSATAETRGFYVIVPELRGHGRTAGNINSPEYKRNGGNPGSDSLHKMADDIALLAAERREEVPDSPIFLLGHSMGSVVAQLAVMENGEMFDGLVLTGLPSDHRMPELLRLIRDEICRRGPKAECEDTFHSMFDSVNKPFEPAKTSLDWITSDEAMIQASLALPYTSVLFNNEFYCDFFIALSETGKAANWQDVSTQMPVFLLSGGSDVMTLGGESLKEKQQMLRSLGLTDVRLKIYPGLRHSILRERGRNRVMDDIFRWMEIRLKIRMCRAE